MSDHENDPRVQRLQMRARIRQAFSPATPVTTKEIFAGRVDQLDRIFDIISTPGQHALVYGERGVGKTSLARVANDIFSNVENFYWAAVYYTCDTTDTFESIWRHVFSRMSLNQARNGVGFTGEVEPVTTSVASMLPADAPITANVVCQLLEHLTRGAGSAQLVVFIDEFDRPEDEVVSRAMADVVKILADHASRVTIVLLGVGETVTDLMRGHESVHRSLVEIQMPLMRPAELAEIVAKGFKATGLTGDQRFGPAVAKFALGLPHYAHLLAQEGALAAVDDGRSQVTMNDFDAAVHAAIDGASQSIREAYHQAVTSNRETLYAEVLLACARAPKDRMGTFGAPDVREQLRAITGIPREIPAFAHHLNDFSGSTPPRGGILVKRGEARRFRYKFTNPLMPPYILMVGHDSEGK